MGVEMEGSEAEWIGIGLLVLIALSLSAAILLFMCSLWKVLRKLIRRRRRVGVLPGPFREDVSLPRAMTTRDKYDNDWHTVHHTYRGRNVPDTVITIEEEEEPRPKTWLQAVTAKWSGSLKHKDREADVVFQNTAWNSSSQCITASDQGPRPESLPDQKPPPKPWLHDLIAKWRGIIKDKESEAAGTSNEAPMAEDHEPRHGIHEDMVTTTEAEERPEPKPWLKALMVKWSEILKQTDRGIQGPEKISRQSAGAGPFELQLKFDLNNNPIIEVNHNEVEVFNATIAENGAIQSTEDDDERISPDDSHTSLPLAGGSSTNKQDLTTTKKGAGVGGEGLPMFEFLPPGIRKTLLASGIPIELNTNFCLHGCCPSNATSGESQGRQAQPRVHSYTGLIMLSSESDPEPGPELPTNQDLEEQTGTTESGTNIGKKGTHDGQCYYSLTGSNEILVPDPELEKPADAKEEEEKDFSGGGA